MLKKFFIKQKGALALALMIGLFFLGMLFRESIPQNRDPVPVGLQINIVILPLLIALLALARYSTNRSNHYAFICAGFVGAALFDWYDMFINFLGPLDYIPIEYATVSEWSWFLGSTFLASFILLSWILNNLEKKYSERARPRPIIIFMFTWAIIVSAFLVLSQFRLDSLYMDHNALISRPAEIIPATIFLISLIGYLREKNWSKNIFDSWLIFSLIIFFLTEAIFMSQSNQHFDALYTWAGVFKTVGYSFILFGLLLDIYDVYKQSEIQREKLFQRTQELQKYQLAIEYASDKMVITDAKGIIVYANRATELVTGYKLKEVLGKKPSLWGGNMSKEYYKEMWDTILVKKKPFLAEFFNRKKNGEEFIEQIHIAPILDEKGNTVYIVGIGRDVTREKQVDMAKSEFITLASHQLLSPLSIVNWHVELLNGSEIGELNNDQREIVSGLDRTNKRLIRLVKSLIRIFKIEMGSFEHNPEIVDLHEIMNDAFVDLKPKIEEKHVRIVCNCKEKFEVFFDPTLLSIVVTNLLSNSIKYSKQEGGVVEVRAQRNADNVRFTVTDNGLGIPTDQQDKIFTKFFRAPNAIKQEAEGSGLGLHIVKSILDKVGCSITFISEENEGSTFSVTLPTKMEVIQNSHS